MNREKLISFAGVIAAVFFWGLSFLSIKVTLEVLPVMTQAFIRFAIAAITLFVMMKLFKTDCKVDYKDIPKILMAGLLGITLYFFFENTGIKYISASSAALVVSTVPILTVVAEAIVFKTTLTKSKIISVALSLVGVYLIVGYSNGGTSSDDTLFGFGMMLAASVSWVLYTIATKSLSKKYSELTIVYYQTVLGTLTLLPFAVFEKTTWKLVTYPIVLNMLFLGVLCSAIATYLYVYAMDRIGVSICSLIMNFIPVVAVAASILFLGERASLLQLAGGAIVVAAVYLCEKAPENSVKMPNSPDHLSETTAI